MAWRPLKPGELDHEAIWLAVSTGTAALGLVWTCLSLPRPVCIFKAMTGCPCPGCGATRAFVALTHGDIATALHFNPLATLAAGAVLAFDLYAIAVLLLRLSRWRAENVPRAAIHIARWGSLAAVLANWAWLIRAGV